MAEEQRSNLAVLRLNNRDAHTDYKAAHDYSDIYDMAVSSDAAHSYTALVGEQKNIFRAHEDTFQAVTSVTSVTNSEIIDYQWFPNFVFCNMTLKK